MEKKYLRRRKYSYIILVRIKDIANALEMFAPLPLQDGFDNAGLQIGLTEAEVAGVLLCLDVTEAVVAEVVPCVLVERLGKCFSN